MVIVRIYINIPSKLALCLRLNFFISANKNHPPFSFHSNSLEISHGLLSPMLSTSNSCVFSSFSLYKMSLLLLCSVAFRTVNYKIHCTSRKSEWLKKKKRKKTNESNGTTRNDNARLCALNFDKAPRQHNAIALQLQLYWPVIVSGITFITFNRANVISKQYAFGALIFDFIY